MPKSNLRALSLELSADEMSAIAASATRGGRTINGSWMAGRWDDLNPALAAPLTAQAFKPYGDVIETAACAPRSINQGYAQRFNDLCGVDAAREGGAVNVSLFTANPRPHPIAIQLMERPTTRFAGLHPHAGAAMAGAGVR